MPLRDGITDATYHTIFKPVIKEIIDRFRPGAIVLQMGADSLSGDKLGGFNMTLNGEHLRRAPDLTIHRPLGVRELCEKLQHPRINGGRWRLHNVGGRAIPSTNLAARTSPRRGPRRRPSCAALIFQRTSLTTDSEYRNIGMF